MSPAGRPFVSMQVKFLCVLLGTGVSVVAAALILIPLAISAYRASHGEDTLAVTNSLSISVPTAITLGGILFFLCLFLVVLVLYNHRQTRAILRLSRDVEAISGGDLNGAISSERNDEIGRLARNVDTMRSTILLRMEERQEAWQANSDLITSMTHDIRTPLTSLMGYLELLEQSSEGMTEEQQTYLRVLSAKTEQIKGLSDELFLYFWAFNRVNLGGDEEAEGEVLEAGLLLGQLMGEYALSPETEGMEVVTELSAILPTDTVRVRVDLLRRVTDNLFSNVRKYADPAFPVTVVAAREAGAVTLTLKNRIRPREERPSGTHIGVKTCANMMRMMGGSFTTEETEDTFSAVLSLPLAKGEACAPLG